MARQTVTTDDVDGSPEARTLTFSYDGQRYEIDLSPENQEKFRQALAPFLANSRVVESPPPAANAATGMLRRLRRSRATSPGAFTDEKPPTGRRPPGSRRRFPARRRLWVPLVCLVLLGGLAAILLPRLLGPLGQGVRPLKPVHCTVPAAADSLPPVKPGDVVCLSGTSPSPLTIRSGGTPEQPVVYSGGGTTTVQGIDVKASNVVVQGFTSDHADSMGAKLLGGNIVFQDNLITHPVYSGDDTDGIRFFGDHIQIAHNTIRDISEGSHCTNDGCGDGPHPDCLQTWYSNNYPTSSDIVIDSNRCEQAAAQCLMAEGPVLPEEGINGPGQSANWLFHNNYCDDGANQALMIKNIKNLTITDNDFQGTNHKAIALADGSTGAHVSGNRVNPRIGKLITFDDEFESAGYIGPEPDK